MNELQALMGDSYKEGMTLEDVSKFFEGKKFADLSTGNYVDKSKYDNQVNSLTTKLNEKEQELNAKLTDEEKNAKASQAQAKEIEELRKALRENTVNGNKNVVQSILQGSRDILGIKAEDTDFTAFVDNFTTEDSDKTRNIANYVSQLINKSYEKGKQDATKDAMGNFGKQKDQSSSGDKEVENLGKKLASAKNSTKSNYDYFK